jgi:hypothetical protein
VGIRWDWNVEPGLDLVRSFANLDATEDPALRIRRNGRTDPVQYTEDQVREILTRESDTRLRLKIAKAREFLRHVDHGSRVADAWQRVALATADLEREWEAARVDRLVLWFLRGGPLNDSEPGDDLG